MPAVTEAAPGGTKKRAVTSIPTALYRRVQTATEQRGTFQTELLLDAYVHHHEALRKRFGQDGDRAGLPPRPRPRRRHRDGVSPCVLFLLLEEREVLDGLAGELGNMSRSELVTHLYELELAGDEEARN